MLKIRLLFIRLHWKSLLSLDCCRISNKSVACCFPLLQVLIQHWMTATLEWPWLLFHWNVNGICLLLVHCLCCLSLLFCAVLGSWAHRKQAFYCLKGCRGLKLLHNAYCMSVSQWWTINNEQFTALNIPFLHFSDFSFNTLVLLHTSVHHWFFKEVFTVFSHRWVRVQLHCNE